VRRSLPPPALARRGGSAGGGRHPRHRNEP
jgi:hypothetical protein